MRSILALCLLLALSAPAQADRSPRPWPEAGGRGSAEGGAMSLDAAVALARRETGGKVLSAETVNDGGRLVHRVKVLTPDQRVRVLRYPARR